MSGIMTATVGTVTAVGILYGAGLYNTTTGVDLSPIDGSAQNSGFITRTWIGYFRSAISGPVTLSLSTSASAGTRATAETTGRLWFGSTAISGFNDSNANIAAFGNQTVNTNFTMALGAYYPVRIRWDGNYVEGEDRPFSSGGNGSGSITFLAAGSSNVTDRIFYNTLTNGF
jgi:hypothetical protein